MIRVRIGRFLLIGVVLLMSLGLPAPAAVGAAGVAAAPVTLNLSAGPGGSAAVDPPGPTYDAGKIVTLTATASPGSLFVGWTIDGAMAGWASPRKLVMDRSHDVTANFAPALAFSDLPANAAEADAIRQISARGVIQGYTPEGCATNGVAAPCFGPADPVLRGEIAVMIVRALGWEGRTPSNIVYFSDVADYAPAIQRAIAILADLGVMQGYGNGLAGPGDKVLRIQVIALITRAMVKAGYWQEATANDASLYPNIDASSVHRLDLVTFVQNAGPIPDRPQNQNWDDWLTNAPRSWTARVLWQVLNTYFTSGTFNPNPTNEPPVATADSYQAGQDRLLTIAAPGVLGNDSDPNGDPLTAVLAGGPAHAASFALNADGSFAYTPANGYSGPDSFTYQARDPNGALSAVTTAAIDVTANDPAPTVTATTPTNGATGVATNTNLTVTFSEPVNVAGSWFSIACQVSGAHTAAVTGGPTTFTLNPDTDLTAGESCTATIIAAQVTDQDANDPYDAMLANYPFSFTADAAPTVASTTPANGIASVASNVNITVTFSESVNVTGSWFTISCATSGPHTATVTGGPTTFTLDPTTDFATGESCTVTIVAAQVADQDSGDPPDTMALDYVFTFGADSPPVVTATTPVNGATQVATNSNLTVTFSKPVDVTGTWFTINCTTSGPHTAVSSGGPITFTLNPGIDFAAGEACTVTIVATQVSDQDTNDPPDAMAADYVFTFTTDAAPSVTTTSPANGATSVVTGSAITIAFSENVSASSGAFSIACPVGAPQTFTTSASPASSFTLTPSAPLPAGTTCTVTVLATAITDTDSADPPDTLPTDYVFSFDTIVDIAPSVTATTPANGASAALAASITVTFSESVNVTGTWFTIVCAISGTHTAVVTGGPTTFTLNPDTDFTAGELCTVTVIATQVTDQDTDDPPNAMAMNYSFSFTADSPPTVLSVSPANGALGVATDTNITVNFSESVTVTNPWFTISCVTSGAHTAVVSGGPMTFTLNPGVDFAPNETCTVTILAAQVADQDGAPNNLAMDYTFTFGTDAAPSVSSTTPTNGATGVAAGANVTVTFSEPVNVVGNWFQIVCPTSGTRTVANTAVTGGPISFTIDPNVNFAAGETCTATIVAAQVADQDSGDPPDSLAADYVFAFTTDTPPTVSSTAPATGATQVATNTNLTVTFSEPVTVTGTWFTISCATSGAHTASFSGGPTTFTLDPSPDFSQNELCTVTIFAAQVADQDGAADNMASNYTFTFTTDAAPFVSSTTPINGATGVAASTNITINFSENVAVSASSFQIECPTGSGAQAFALSGSNASYTLNPTADLPGGTVCTVTVFATGVSDTDSGDPPDTMVANYTFSFSLPPVARNDTYTATIIGNVGVNTALSSGFSITTNDSGSGLTISTSGTTANGGSVVVAANGTFTYRPAPGYEGDDSFTYTISNAAGTSASATVTLQTVSGVIWFVDANAGINGDGRIGTPFNSLPNFVAGAADQAGDRIFLYESATNYSGPLTLLANQRLIGQDAGSPLETLAGVTKPADSLALPTMNTGGQATTIGGSGLTLNAGNQLHGFTLSTTSGTAITGSSFGTLTVSTVIVSATGGSAANGAALSLTNGTLTGSFTSISSTGGTNNILLSGVGTTGTFAFGSGALSTATAEAFRVTGASSGTMTYTGTIANSASRVVSVSNTSAGSCPALTLSGNLTSSGSGTGIIVNNCNAGTITFSGASKSLNTAGNAAVTLTGNTGATINFTNGGLAIATTASNGFSATGGGTVTVQGAVNTIASDSGIALNVNSTTIGAQGLTFRSISAGTSSGSAGNGIVLDTTGTSGGLTITGNGSAGTGGTIQHKTGSDGSTTGGIGIYLNSTQSVSLSWMQLNDFDNLGIFGTSVSGFSLSNSVINGTIGTSSGSNDAPIAFGKSIPNGANGLSGTNSITDTIIRGGIEGNVEVYNQSGSFTLTITRTTIRNNSAALGADGILMETQGTANGTIVVDNCDFIDNKSQAIQVNALDSSAADVTVKNSRANRTTQGNEGIILQNAEDADLTAHITNNTITGLPGTAIFVGETAGNATASSNLIAFIKDNTVISSNPTQNRLIIAFLSSCTGQSCAQGQHPTANILIDHNTVTAFADPVNGLAEVIFVSTPDGNTDPRFTATVINNIVTINDPNQLALRGIAVQSTQGPSAGDHAEGCFDVRSNSVTYTPNGPAAGINGIRVRQVGFATLQLEQGGSSGSAATVLAANNPGTGTEVVGTVNVVANTTCQNPPTSSAGPVTASTPIRTQPSAALIVAPAGVSQWQLGPSSLPYYRTSMALLGRRRETKGRVAQRALVA